MGSSSFGVLVIFTLMLFIFERAAGASPTQCWYTLMSGGEYAPAHWSGEGTPEQVSITGGVFMWAQQAQGSPTPTLASKNLFYLNLTLNQLASVGNGRVFNNVSCQFVIGMNTGNTGGNFYNPMLMNGIFLPGDITNFPVFQTNPYSDPAQRYPCVSDNTANIKTDFSVYVSQDFGGQQSWGLEGNGGQPNFACGTGTGNNGNRIGWKPPGVFVPLLWAAWPSSSSIFVWPPG